MPSSEGIFCLILCLMRLKYTVSGIIMIKNLKIIPVLVYYLDLVRTQVLIR